MANGQDIRRTSEYGKGRSLLYADIGREEAGERGRFERQLSRAEKLRKDQAEKMGWARFLGKAGYILGPEVGVVTENLFPLAVDVMDPEPEKAFVSTDPGKFGVSRRYDYEEINRLLKEGDEAQTWQAVTDFGKSVFSGFEMAGGEFGDPGAYRFGTYGGEKGATKHGRGVFGRGGDVLPNRSLWDIWFNKQA